MNPRENTLGHWLHEQARLQRQRYLILDPLGNTEALHALIAALPPTAHVRLYADTPVSGLAGHGPVLFQLPNGEVPALAELLAHPEGNWGWLASAEGDALHALARHWRERLIVGQPPQRTLYRFHDNRVLGRALDHLAEHDLPAYLGPIASLCYWHATAGEWRSQDNPAPGEHPLPDAPAWLATPRPAAMTTATRHENLRHRLMESHPQLCEALAERGDFGAWLAERLQQAQQWQWTSPEQLHFWVMECLEGDPDLLTEQSQPRPGEPPEVHFARVSYAASVRANGGLLP